jgi:uncharacterized protein (TIGR03083 family)
MDLAGIYAETRGRIVDLVRGLSPDELVTTVPATPEWTVRDVVGHLTGVCADVMEGRLEGAATPPWTAAQIDARRAKSLEEVLAEWDERSPAIEAMLAGSGMAVNALVADVVTHEQDIRSALGRPGARDSAGMDAALQIFAGGLDARLRAQGRPAIRIDAGSQEWVLGEGDPAATLATNSYDLTRALIGRRSRAQVAAMGWDGDSEPFLDVFAGFPMSETDLAE